MSQENPELMHRAIEAINRRDVEAFRALCTPDVEIVPLRAALEGTVYRGPEAPREMFAEFGESWADLHVETKDVRADGDWVLGLGSVRMVGTSSGAPIELNMGWVMRSRHGLIKSLRTYANSAEALKAVGLAE